jgi:acyl-CoA hydrolase
MRFFGGCGGGSWLMSTVIKSDTLDLQGIVKPGDHIMWSHACGEPLTLIEALLSQRARLGRVHAFAATGFSNVLKPGHADHIAFSSMGAMGALRSLAKAHVLSVIPCHFGQIPRLIGQGIIPCDVFFVQVSPPNADGSHSFGVVNDYMQAAIARARVVVAEVNDQAPRTACDRYLPASRIDYLVHSSRPLVEIKGAPISATDRAIASFAAAYIQDGCILQTGIGAVPDAITQLIGDRRDMGVHSGMIGDGIVDLIQSGAITNALKPFDVGLTVTGSLMGSRRLFDFAHDNPALKLCASSYTHDEAVLSRLPRLVTINSALEVDLTGQVNSEQAGPLYLGGTGGQVDYVRAGSRSAGGCSLIALPATASDGAASRIVKQLSGPVSTARTEVDVIVTEFGAAELKGRPIAERARRLAAIAHPQFREDLEREAHALRARGY